MKRALEPWLPVCHWDGEAQVKDSPFRTPVIGVKPTGSAGWKVCGPTCPKRPAGERIYMAKQLDMTTGRGR